ncbi:MAG: 4Fe-4S binding protein [Bacteroidota bacterium]
MLRIALVLALELLAIHAARAGVLTRDEIQRRFGVPFVVEEKLTDIPAWPVTSSLEKEAGPVAYVFESIDIAPLPGFEGSPMNFLISIDRKGTFTDVEVLQQREPVFTFRDLGGLGDAPLRDFIAQYIGKSITQPFVIALDAARNHTGTTQNRGAHATLDGISKATTSVRIVNQTLLASALEVARAKLGFADHKKRGPAAKARPEVFDSLTFAELLDQGMVGRLRLSNAAVEKLFAGTDGAEVDAEALAHPDDLYVDLYVAYLNAPTIGRAILGDAQYRAVMERNFENRHLWWIASAGRFQIVDEDFTPGAQSPRVALAQDGGFLDFRDQGFEPLGIVGPPPLNSSRLFGVGADASIDPGQSLDLVLTITRAKGMVLPTLTHRQVKLAYHPPSRLFAYPPTPLPEWLLAWKSRWPDLAVIGLSLLILAVVLARPRWISVKPARLRNFRLGFLAYTLVFLGWYAQGQLSIVQITGAFKTLKSGLGFSAYLYDPVSLLLIGFTVVSFIAWGRGAFCGWLCPFGALQEFVALAARKLRLPQLNVPPKFARQLEWGRYAVLAALIICAIFAPELGVSLNEVEPFKTSITVAFNRGWPFVAYALLLLAAGAVYFKFFCRFICPLGAVMSIGGKLRRLDWLSRRRECGKPCQRCKVVCNYEAIEAGGEIRYDACFQCLDCVGIYHDEQRCVPVMLYEKKGKVLVPRGQAA